MIMKHEECVGVVNTKMGGVNQTHEGSSHEYSYLIKQH